MTPAERVEEMFKKYSKEEIDIAKEIHDESLPRDRRERAWSKRLLLLDILTDLTRLKAEMNVWENTER